MSKLQLAKPTFNPRREATKFVEAHREYQATRAAYKWLTEHVEYHGHPNFEAMLHEISQRGLTLRFDMMSALDAFLGDEQPRENVQKGLNGL